MQKGVVSITMFSQSQLKKVMQQMNAEPLDVKSVIFELADGSRLVISGPEQVVRMKMMGQESYQVVGAAVKEENKVEGSYSEDDVSMVASQAGVGVDEARKALEESEGDIAGAIMRLKNDKE